MAHPYKLLIDKRILLTLACLGFAMIMVTLCLKLTHTSIGITAHKTLLLIALVSYLPWSVVLIDLIRNRARNKTLWLLGMVCFGSLTTILYLINREKPILSLSKIKSYIRFFLT